MNRQPVDSSLIRAVGYDLPSSILEVELAGDGSVYDYFDVPLSAYTELMEAESKGEYFNEFIKDLYAFRKREIEAAGAPRRPAVAMLGMLAERAIDVGIEPSARYPSSESSRPDRPRRPTGLEREIAVFRARLPEFLEEHDGQFVLIRGEEVAGFWPTFDEALEAGLDRFGPVVPLLVKQVLAVEPIAYFSRGI